MNVYAALLLIAAAGVAGYAICYFQLREIMNEYEWEIADSADVIKSYELQFTEGKVPEELIEEADDYREALYQK